MSEEIQERRLKNPDAAKVLAGMDPGWETLGDGSIRGSQKHGE